MKFLFATTNKSKIEFYANKLKEKGLDIVTLNDLNIKCDINESGKDPIENALIKGVEYNKLSGIPTIALDDGLYFENVPEYIQPGTHVRRVDGMYLNDTEMIEYYTNLVNKYDKDGKLNGYFLKGIAIVSGDKKFTFSRKANYIFSNMKSKTIHDGYPLDSIIINEKYNKFLSELTDEDKESVSNTLKNELLDFILQVEKELN